MKDLLLVDSMSVQIEAGWLEKLQGEFQKDYMKKLKEELMRQKNSGISVYPKSVDIFNAFNYTPFDDVKVVILWQDPYHWPGQAHGLCFSVQDGVTPPPSLKNMYKELWNSGQINEIPTWGNLEHRAKQWVFLLNAVLTVKAHEAASHRDLGWQQFTDHVIETLSNEKEGLVFLLRWSFAKSKSSLIDKTKHYVLTTSHPSPLSAYRGFLGSNCFVECNELLNKQWKTPISR